MKRKEKNEQETIEDGEKGTPNGWYSIGMKKE